MQKRVLAYARVSSAEQALGTSLQDQQNAIAANAKSRGLKVTKSFVESESAVFEKAERREQVQALLAEVRRGDLVLVDKLDRWSRDIEFTHSSVRKIHEAGASIYFVAESLDPSTPEGDMSMGFRAVMAKEEHRRIKVRMVGTRKLLRAQGFYSEGQAPWGYKRQDTKGTGRNVLIIDPEAAPLVREVYRRCVVGQSIQGIATALDVGRGKVIKCLGNRIYLGELDGKPAKHPALVDAATWLRAREALTGRRLGKRAARTDSQTADWWLRDLALCLHCGAKLTSAYGPQRANRPRNYYFQCRKRCTSKLVPVPVAEEACYPLFVDRLAELRAELASPPLKPVKVAPVPDLAARKAKLAAKRARYTEMYAEGTITHEALHAAIAKLDVEATKLEALAHVEPPPAPEQRKVTLAHTLAIWKSWKHVNATERRAIANALAKSVRLAAGEDPQIEWTGTEDLARTGSLALVGDILGATKPAENSLTARLIRRSVG